jgi:acyl-coenzyme A synthetase/AMP-(fatty) acid ligase
VAFGREGTRSGAELRTDVAALAARLAPIGGGRLLLHCEDAYAFAVGLLAAGQVGACVVLSPTRQPGALRRLASQVQGVLLDGAGDADPFEGLPCWHPLEVPRSEWALRALDRCAPLVELFTSGTTGAGASVTKALRHLEDETLVLEEVFGAELGMETRILATASPQHLYGLLFRVLWPLCARRPFLRSSPLQPEELSPHLEGDAPFALVTTPVSLRHLVEKDRLAGRGGACRAVFSSGSPLAATIARRVAEALGAAPWEVYGSTETGGVAVRRQQRGGEPWRLLPRVEAQQEPGGERLVVASPFVSAGAPLPDARGRFVLADRVAFDGERFRLLGRTDRVVKVGEKRLSLPDMEECLKRHPSVSEVALVPLEHAREARIGAVVVPTAAGSEVLAAGGRRALAKLLTEHLAPDYDRVLLPRVWRIARALPADPRGKLPLAELRALFGDPGARPRAPETLGVARSPRAIEAELRIPDDLAFLEGHFPSFPVVAGVVQLHFAMGALAELLGAAPRLEALEAWKLQRLLRPGQRVTLRLQLSEDLARFEFALADAGHPERVFSSGRGRLGRHS